MTGWTTEPLEDCLDALLDYRGKSPMKSEWGIPVLSARVVKTSGLLRPIEQTIAPEYYPKWMTRGFPRPGDVVMTTEAPLGEVIQLDNDTATFALGQRLVCLRGKAKKLDNTFLRYLLTSPGQQEILASRATGTTVLGISQKTLRSMPISFPDYAEQENIGGLLASLDDKIELNRRMNETLEAMARALFRDWFVDFGPTRAKMAGITPYLSDNLWSLFPDRLDDEGKPEGWEAGKMSDLFTLQRGFDLPSQDRREGSYPILAASGPSGFHESHMVKGPGVTTGRSGVLGRVFFVHGDFWPLNTSLWVKDYKRATPRYAYFFLNLIDLAGFNAGSAVPTLNRNHIHGLPAVLPPHELVRTFELVAQGLMARQRHNEIENETLAQTRDLLLPRLMSGELRFAGAEPMLEEVA